MGCTGKFKKQVICEKGIYYSDFRQLKTSIFLTDLMGCVGKNKISQTPKYSPCGQLRNGGRGVDPRLLPKCQARAKSSGALCRQVALKGKRVCYYHGGKSTGPRDPFFKHGRYTKQNKEWERQLRIRIKVIKFLSPYYPDILIKLEKAFSDSLDPETASQEAPGADDLTEEYTGKHTRTRNTTPRL